MADRPDWPPLSLPSDSPAYLLWWQRHSAGEAQPAQPGVELSIQVATAYECLKRGLSEIETRMAIQREYGHSSQPKLAFTKALKMLVAEQHDLRKVLPEVVMALRMRAIQGALARHEYGAAARLLADAGAVAGELDKTNIDTESAVLEVRVLGAGEGRAVQTEIEEKLEPLEVEVTVQGKEDEEM